MKKFYVYLHRRLSDSLPFYLGKGTGDRAWRKSHRSFHWKNIVNKHGYTIEILQEFDDEQEALQYEIDGIAALKEAGYNLCNITDGGEGVSGLKHSEKAKEAMRQAKTGLKHSEEHKAKISATLKAKGINNTKHLVMRHHLYRYTGTSTIDGTQIIFDGGSPLITQLGLNQVAINACCRGKAKHHKGYTFTRELLKDKL
jgi:hypothetical protein